MSWFGGFFLRRHASNAYLPPDANLLRDGKFAVWTVSKLPSETVRVVAEGTRWSAIFGVCNGSDDELLKRFSDGHEMGTDEFYGSHTIVICDEYSIKVSTDIANARPIYTANTEFGVVWSSSSLELASLVGREINVPWLATTLLAPDVEPALTLHSAFSRIRMVPAGSWLVIDENSITLGREAAWKVQYRTKTNATEKLAETLQGGVAARLHISEKITADCSGGFDSTTLTLLALNQIDNRDRLAAITLHPCGVTRGGDLDCVSRLLTSQPKLRHRWIGLDDSHLPFTYMDQVPATDEPAPMTAAYARMVYQFRSLRDIGSEVHLTGDGGDTLLCAPLLYLADLLAAGWYKTAYRHIIGWSRIRRVSPWPLFREALIATRRNYAESLALLSASFNGGLSSPALDDEMETPSATWHDVRTGPWFTDLAYQSASEMLLEAAHRILPASLDRAGQLTLNVLRTVGRTARSDIQLAASHGIVLDNPYLDPSVVSAVLSVSACQWSSPEHFKPLLTQAFPNLLPKSIAERTTKGSFEIDQYRGARVHAALLHDLADGKLATLGLIDPKPLHQAIDLAVLGLPVNLIGVERVVAAEAWLRAVEAAPTTTWRVHLPA